MFIFLFGGNKDHILLNKLHASCICLFIYLDRQVFSPRYYFRNKTVDSNF